MCRLRHNPRYSRRVDIRPRCDIDSSILVSVGGIPARLTEKNGLRGSVAFITMSAAATSARGVARVYQNCRDTRTLRFIRGEALELIEGPTVQVGSCFAIPLPASNLYPFADVLQVLKSKPQTVALRGFYKTFSDAVVYVCSETALPTGKLFKLALSRARPALLQAFTEAAALTANFVDVRPGVCVPKRIGSEVDYPGIYAEVALYIFGRRLRDAARCQKVEVAPDVNKVAFALLKLEEFKLALNRGKKHLLTAFQRPDRNAELVQLPSQDAVIVGNRAVRVKRAERFLVQLVGIRNLGFASHDHLRRKREGVLSVIVDQTVKAKLAKRPSIPSHTRDVIARLIRPFKRRQERSVLFGGGQKAYFRRQLHSSSVSQSSSLEYIGACHSGSPFLASHNLVLRRLKVDGLLAALR